MTVAERVFSLTRTFAASPERVYNAWLDHAVLFQWSAPANCTMVSLETDSRVGGRWESRFLFGTGEEHVTVGEYLELVPGQRIVMRQMNTSEIAPATNVPTIVTVDFEQIAPGQTRMHFSMAGAISESDAEWMPVGWESRFDELNRALEGNE
jgi:uncharacterized protein YndB with AHSA1/START domain